MKFKERCSKFKKIAIDFWNKNKTTIVAVGGFIIGAFVTYKLVKTDSDASDTSCILPDPPNDLWDEDAMRKNWDWMCELASSIDMEPGEAYWIQEGTGIDGCGVLVGDNYVCHTLDGEEVYPYDYSDYEEKYEANNETENDNGNELEDDENDYYAKITINEDDPAVKDIVRKFVVLANSNSVSIKRKDDE